MAKTNPIGVRFDETLLNKLKEASIVDSPQKALNIYEKSYVELVELKVKNNNKPETKKKTEEERNGTATDTTERQYPNDTQTQISELEKELEAIPDKTKGLGKMMAESLNKKIFNLKYGNK